MSGTANSILLVEDEALIALQEKRQLERAGYSVIHALDGEAAISTVSARPDAIDLILMDIDLGRGMDGTEAAREILNRFDIPLLFLSGHQEEDIVARTESITNYGYVVKSSVFTVLHASIKMAFKLFAAKKQLDLNSLEIETANEQLTRTIQDLRAAHQELKTSENKFSKIFQLNPEYISISTLADGRFLDVNEGFSTMTGYRREEVIGRSALSSAVDLWVFPEQRRQLLRELENSGEVMNFDVLFRRKDGTTFEGLVDGKTLELDGQECLLALVRDVTRQKKLEADLMESEARWRTMVEAIPDSIAVISGDHTVEFASPKCVRFMGYSAASEALGRGFEDFLRASDRDRAQYAIAGILKGEGGKSEVFTLLRRDGTEVVAEINAELYRSPTEGAASVLLVIRDLTERIYQAERLSKSESRFRMLIESMQEGFCQFDGEDRITYANRAAEGIFGVGRDGLIGRSILDFLNETSREVLSVQNEKRRSGETSSYEAPIVRPDGQQRLLAVSSTPLTDFQGHHVGSSSVFRDITSDREAT